MPGLAESIAGVAFLTVTILWWVMRCHTSPEHENKDRYEQAEKDVAKRDGMAASLNGRADLDELDRVSRSKGSPRDIYSIGARVKSLPGKLHGWDYFMEAVGQFGGVNQGGQRLDQRALASAVGGGYTWKEVWASPRLGLEYDYATGDHNPNDDTSETLDNLFPTNHKHYGLMDFLSWRNMQDLRFALGLKPMKKLTVSVDYFLFWLADTHDFFYPQGGAGRSGLGYGRNPGFDSFLGSELDVELNYAVTSWAGVRAGYGHFFTDSYIDSSKQSVGGATDADWFYVQATLLF